MEVNNTIEEPTNLNDHIATEFQRLIDYVKSLYTAAKDAGDNSEKSKQEFRLKTFKNVLATIKKLPFKITNVSQLDGHRGIGDGTKKRIDEIIRTGRLSEIPSSIIAASNKTDIVTMLSGIVGVGEAIAKELVQTHNVTSVDDLIERHKKGEIEVNDKIALGLKYYHSLQRRIPREEIDDFNDKLQQIVAKLDPKFKVIICGSYRRQAPTSGDIDVLVTHADIKTDDDMTDNNGLTLIVNKLKKKKLLVDDLTDDVDTKYMGFLQYKSYPVRRIDIRFVPTVSYAAALLYFTGSKEFNTQMRSHAKKLGYKLNEYGLFKLSKSKKGDILIETNDEKDIFDVLKMPFVEPHMRG
jgi:DNA polymerase beta